MAPSMSWSSVMISPLLVVPLRWAAVKVEEPAVRSWLMPVIEFSAARWIAIISSSWLQVKASA